MLVGHTACLGCYMFLRVFRHFSFSHHCRAVPLPVVSGRDGVVVYLLHIVFSNSVGLIPFYERADLVTENDFDPFSMFMLRGLALTLAASFTIVAAQSCGTSCAVLGCDFYEKGCPCQCSKCVKHNDCCSDWDAACDGGHGSAAGPDAGPEQHHLSLTASPSEIV